jgi:propanol-preferring alcohol dehydrogenase
LLEAAFAMTSIPKTMLAWQKHSGITEPVRVELAVPSAPADGLLIKVHAAGVCHSDVAILNMKEYQRSKGKAFTLGHEGAGVVVEIGSQVTGFEIGERIAINSVAGCMRPTCSECSRNLAQICQQGERYGIGTHGSYAPYIAIKAHHAAKLPDSVSFAQGAVATDACMTAYHAIVGTGQVKKGETVMIVGLGGLGFNALQIAQSVGARVIVTDRRQEVLDEAAKFGLPKEDIIPAGVSVPEFVKDNKLVIDTIIDFVGVVETFEASQEAGMFFNHTLIPICLEQPSLTVLSQVRYGGKLVQVGLLAPSLTIDNFKAVTKQLSILCSYGGTMSELRACIELIAEGELRPQVVTGRLDDLPQVLVDLHEGKIKSRIALLPDL